MSACLALPCRNPPGSAPQSYRTIKELQPWTCSPEVLAALTNTPHSPGPCALKQVDFEGSQTPCKTNQITSVRQTGLGFVSPYDSHFAWEIKRHQGLLCKRHSHPSGPAPILPPFRVQPNCRAGTQVIAQLQVKKYAGFTKLMSWSSG